MASAESRPSRRSSSRPTGVPGRPTRFRGLLPLLALIALGTGCEDTVIETVPVDRVVVTPDAGRVVVGSSLKLDAELLDFEGRPITGVPVSWASVDPGIAEVTADGMATGRAPGEVVVQATADGKTGTATLTVAGPAQIVLGRTSVGFTTSAGATSLPPVDVSITNLGEEPLESLSASTEYADGEPTGWLDVELGSTRADTYVRLTAAVGDLQAGSYSATVRVSDPGASNSPATIAVALEVREGVPLEPSDLDARTVDGGIELEWRDNSADETEFRIERQGPDDADFSGLGLVGPGATSYLDTAVEPDRSYRYRVRACNAAGCSGPSGEAEAVTRPYAPSSLSASARSNESIALIWRDESRTETGFRIERRLDGGSFSEVAAVGSDVTDYLDTGLDPATRYTYRIRACNDGGCSDASGEASARTQDRPVPASPSDLAIVDQSADRIRIRWTDNSSIESSFEVHRRGPGESGFGRIGGVGANVEAYTDQDVEVDGSYAYRVRACAEGGCSPFSAEVTGTTPPAPPESIGAEALSSSAIRVSWSDPNGTTTELRVERSRSGGSFQEIGPLAPGTSALEDTGLDPGTRYAYRLRACNEGGCSGYSAEAEAQTAALAVPNAPSGLSLEVVDGTSIRATWDDNSDDETSFRLERRSPGSQVFGTVAIKDADQTSHLDSSVAEDASYTYRVRACAEGGCSSATGEVSATTRPLAPSGLEATAESSSRIALRWVDNAATEVNVEVERATGDGAFGRVALLGPNSVAWDDGGVRADNRYRYRVRTCNDGGCSPYSDPVEATTPGTPAPTAPSGLTADAVSAGRIDLEWNDNSDNETSFEIWRKTGPGGNSAKIATEGPGANSYSDQSNLASGTEYIYRVRACGDAGCSEFSEPASATTPKITAPSGFEVRRVSEDYVDLAWQDSEGESEYRILRRHYRNGSGTGWQVRAKLDAGATRFRDTDVKEEWRYGYRVEACTADGVCASTSEIIVEIPDD